MQPTIVALVEGQSEVASARLLLNRLAARRGRFDVQAARPIRFKRTQITQLGVLERFLLIAERDRPGVAGILVLLDVDDDCAATVGPELTRRAQEATALPVCVVCAVREFEAWLLAASASLVVAGRLQAGEALPTDPEGVRDAKGRLGQAVPAGRSYVEVSDQVAFVAAMDLDEVERRSSSFRKLVRDVDALLGAIPVQ